MDGGGKPEAATTTVGVRELREGLARYLSEAEAGATVVVTRDGKPVARLVPPEDAPPVRIPWGALKGQIWMADDFDEPCPEMEFDGPTFPDRPAEDAHETPPPPPGGSA